MADKNPKRANLRVAVTIVTAIATVLLVVERLSPEGYAVSNALLVLVFAGLLFLGYFIFPALRANYLKYARLEVMLLIAFLIPASQFLLLDSTARELIAVSVQAILFVILVGASREWRTMRRPKLLHATEKGLYWRGVLEDKVGRGSGRDSPDGAPDAQFLVRPGRSKAKLNLIILKRLKAEGARIGLPTPQIWRSDRHSYIWPLGIVVSGERIYPDIYNKLDVELSEDTEIHIYASDSWFPSSWFEQGQTYEVELKYEGIEETDTFRVPILS